MSLAKDVLNMFEGEGDCECPKCKYAGPASEFTPKDPAPKEDDDKKSEKLGADSIYGNGKWKCPKCNEVFECDTKK